MDLRGKYGLNNHWEPILEKYMNAYVHPPTHRRGTLIMNLKDNVFWAWVINSLALIWEFIYKLFFRKKRKELYYKLKPGVEEWDRLHNLKWLIYTDDWWQQAPEKGAYEEDDDEED